MNPIEKLQALGTTKEKVKASLVARSIRGIPEDGSCCPLARYLKNEGVDLESIDSDYVRLNGGEKFETPQACANFIHDFDGDPRANIEVVDQDWLSEQEFEDEDLDEDEDE